MVGVVAGGTGGVDIGVGGDRTTTGGPGFTVPIVRTTRTALSVRTVTAFRRRTMVTLRRITVDTPTRHPTTQRDTTASRPIDLLSTQRPLTAATTFSPRSTPRRITPGMPGTGATRRTRTRRIQCTDTLPTRRTEGVAATGRGDRAS